MKPDQAAVRSLFPNENLSTDLKNPLVCFFYTLMDFEYDPIKSCSNKDKHGINFEEATLLWKDPKQIIVPARTVNEERFALIGEYRERIWTAIFTVRDDKIRIISVRRARDGEAKGYYHS